MTLYADDPDVYVDDEITDATGNNLDWTPIVTSGDTELSAEWLGDTGPVRTLRTHLTGLTPGNHRLRLNVPGGNDITLNSITLT